MTIKKPKVLAYDLESATPLPNDDWSRMTECGIGVLGSWSSEEIEPRVWLPEEGPHVLRDFAVHALEHDVFLTWNGLGYDDKMIHAEFPLWAQVLGQAKRLDLILVAGLYAIAARKKLDTAEMTAVLEYGVPNGFPKLVGYKPTASLNVMSGWKLDPTYAATFDIENSKSMDGAQAPIKWQAGSRGEVIGYCLGDTKRLLDLYNHAWDGSPLVNAKGAEAAIPQRVLASRPF